MGWKLLFRAWRHLWWRAWGIFLCHCNCVCSAPMRYWHTNGATLQGYKASASSTDQQPANKSHSVWTTTLISQWCHSHTILTCVRPHARCAVSTATSGGLKPHLSLCRCWAYDWRPVGPLPVLVTTRARLSRAHSTCSASWAHNYTACLSSRRSPQVTGFVFVCRALWHRALFTRSLK